MIVTCVSGGKLQLWRLGETEATLRDSVRNCENCFGLQLIIRHKTVASIVLHAAAKLSTPQQARLKINALTPEILFIGSTIGRQTVLRRFPPRSKTRIGPVCLFPIVVSSMDPTLQCRDTSDGCSYSTRFRQQEYHGLFTVISDRLLASYTESVAGIRNRLRRLLVVRTLSFPDRRRVRCLTRISRPFVLLTR